MSGLESGFHLQLNVPVGDLDATYHHVSHWVSLRYMEQCRIEFLEAIGCPISKLMEIDAFPVVTSIQIRYVREIFGELLTLSCSRIEWSDRACRISQQISKANGKVAVAARVELKFLSQLKKRAVEIPPIFLQAAQRSGIPSTFDTPRTEV